MASQPPAMLPELPEMAATGRIAEIYQEIRLFSGVPCVSSLQRYLAMLPGILEMAWDAIRPAMASGAIPQAGWRLAEAERLADVKKLPPSVLQGWRVDAADLAAIRNIAANFVRVSPVNLVTGACLTQLLTGARPSGAGFPSTWTPPAMLPPMPGNVDPRSLAPDHYAVLLRFATEVDGMPFIPALYRQIAHWPAVLGWLATDLAPRFAASATTNARTALRSAARDAASAIVSQLPGVPDDPALDQDTRRRVLAAIDRYGETSPEMILFGQLLLDALPEPHTI